MIDYENDNGIGYSALGIALVAGAVAGAVLPCFLHRKQATVPVNNYGIRLTEPGIASWLLASG